MNLLLVYINQVKPAPCKEKLLLAARSRLNRMMSVKKTRKHLNAPDYARQHWESGHKQEMAVLLRDVNFAKVP